MNTTVKKYLADVLKKIYEERGSEIFQNKVLIQTCLSDKIPIIQRKYKDLIGYVVDYDVFHKISRVDKNDVEATVDELAEQISEKNRTDLPLTKDIVDMIAVFCGKSDGKKEYATNTPSKPKRRELAEVSVKKPKKEKSLRLHTQREK